VNAILSSCSGLLYTLHILHSHCMPTTSLHDVFRATLITKILYCSPAWSGLCSAADHSRLYAFLCRCKRYGYCPSNFPAVVCVHITVVSCVVVACVFVPRNRRSFMKTSCWFTSVGTAWLHHTCRYTASQHHHAAVGVTCTLPSPANSLFHTREQATETAVLPFTGQSCGTICQLNSDC